MPRPPIFESYSSQMPPPGEDGLPISKPAVFAFIASLLQCLPVLASLAAIGLGVFGLIQVRRKQAIGKPLAIAAIVIGGLTLIAWSAAIVSGIVVTARLSSVEETARGFVEALAEGDMQRALELAADDVSSDQIAEWHLEIAGDGQTADVTTWNFNVGEQDEFDLAHLWNGPYRVEGQVRYRGGAQPTAMRTAVTVVGSEDGMKVQNLIVRPTQTPIPNPEELFEDLRGMEDLQQRLKQLEGLDEEIEDKLKPIESLPSSTQPSPPRRPED